MTERESDAAAGPLAFDHREQVAVRQAGGGFVLEEGSRRVARVVPAADAWRIDAPDDLDGYSLARAGRGGFVLLNASGDDEAARTMPPVGVGGEVGLRYVLLGDGRVFRIVLRPGDGGYELSGWETPGAYLTARFEPPGWKLKATPAGCGIRDLRLLGVMLAAEALDAQEPL